MPARALERAVVAQAATGAGAVLPGATLADVKVARVSAEATAGVAPPGGAQRDGDAEAAAGAS